MIDIAIEWLKKLVFNYISETNFSFLGSFASILGLFITLIIYYNISRIRKEYLIKGRGPAQFGELSAITSQLNKYYSEFGEHTYDIDTELSKLEVILDWFNKYVNKEIKKNIKLTKNYISEYRDENKSLVQKDNCWKIYTQLIKIIAQLESMFKDKNWI